MEFLREFFRRESTKKILILLAIALLLYSMKSLFNLLLLTFLFIYLSNSLEKFIIKKFEPYIKIKQSIVTIIFYLLMIVILIFVIYKYVPIMINQSVSVLNQIAEVSINIDDNSSTILKYIKVLLKNFDIKGYSKEGINLLFAVATNVGKWSINIFMALILSMFFMLEKPKVKGFVSKFKNSKISSLYGYLREVSINFLNSFGKVIQAQILIATTNSIISIIALWIMGFPQLLALWSMIFILSLIPVAGVIISLVPLCLIAYKIGGITKIIYVILMIGIVHALESYILNPKFMSDKTELPVFLTFIVLIVSEHFLGVWGLLIGIPLFIFILDLLAVKIKD